MGGWVICHLSFVICHLSFVICHLSLVDGGGWGGWGGMFVVTTSVVSSLMFVVTTSVVSALLGFSQVTPQCQALSPVPKQARRYSVSHVHKVQPSPQTPLPRRERGFEKYLMSLGTAIDPQIARVMASAITREQRLKSLLQTKRTTEVVTTNEEND